MNIHTVTKGAVAGLAVAVAIAGSAAQATGPSSSDSPYLEPSRPGVSFESILTAGDKVGGYQLVGIPDGLGAYDNGDGTFTLLANHELMPSQGVARAHGDKGAFVSKWTIDKQTLEVESGQDLIQTLNLTSGGTALNRLCSADLPDPTAFFNPSTGNGFDGRIFIDGEETGGGRAFGHVATGSSAGSSWQLPALGGANWENVLANPATGDKTVVLGTSDVAGGEITVYTGEKTDSGNPVERAGLTNGTRGVIKVDDVGLESSDNGIPSGSRFSVVASGGTGFLRPEDAAWDPKNPSDFYFVTTNAFDKPSRLWRLRFDDPANPAAGGTIDELLDGSEGQHMFDNLTITGRGDVLIQEDPGNQSYVARIWRYNRSSGSLTEIAHHDETRFAPGGSGFITQDEESSGIIDASEILGPNTFLLDDQVHAPAPVDTARVVERGQLLAMHVRDRGVSSGD